VRVRRRTRWTRLVFTQVFDLVSNE